MGGITKNGHATWMKVNDSSDTWNKQIVLLEAYDVYECMVIMIRISCDKIELIVLDGTEITQDS